MLRKAILGCASLLAFGFAFAASAEPVRYVLQTPGVV